MARWRFRRHKSHAPPDTTEGEINLTQSSGRVIARKWYMTFLRMWPIAIGTLIRWTPSSNSFQSNDRVGS